jgi:EpsI family protein
MNLWLKNGILLLLMLAASGLAVALRPTHMIADGKPKLELEKMVPRAFGDWHEEKQTLMQVVNPQQKELLDKIYSQLLSRTYVNAEGYRIMLSIAYGTNQSDSMQVHKPEICYPAQGFTMQSKQVSSLATSSGAIPVTRILATLGQRNEPVMYWTTIGDQIVQSGINKKLIELRYALTGKIPDGMLIRVSSIDTDTNNAYQIQDQFSAQMLAALAPENRQRFIGNLHLN